MKSELCEDFGVANKSVTVIRYPVNNAFPDTELTPKAAKGRLGLHEEEKAILFFGRLVPYKGIEYLLEAYRLLLKDKGAKYKLILAGEPKKGAEQYLEELQSVLSENSRPDDVILKAQFVPDNEMELHFKAADVLTLPYKEIFQSGVLFLAYSFGLPVVATDVGSFHDDVIEGSTGYLCKPGDPADLARAIEKYFASDLYRNLNVRRQELREHANANHSWQAVADLTSNAYAGMLARKLS
jgi:glycosyltransferase involved in cell wall biosynthesis